MRWRRVRASISPRVPRNVSFMGCHQVNKLLRCEGVFWMDESYDHLVRDGKELAAFRDYIAENPTKARLKPHEYALQLRKILLA